MRFFILRTPLRFGENTLKKAYNQIMYNSRTRSTLCPLRCPKSLNISPPPISCAENKKHVVICLSMCLQYMISIFAPFRSKSCVRSSRQPMILHCTSFQSYTSAPHGFGILALDYLLVQVVLFPFRGQGLFPKPFSRAFPMVCFSFLQRVCPINRLKAERKVITPNRCVIQASPTREQCPENHLCFLIIGLFRVVIKKHKRFSKYGDSCQAPYSSLKVIQHFVQFLIFPTAHQQLQSFQSFVYYFMRLRSVHSFRLHCAPGTTFVPHSEPLRYILPAFKHPPQHPTALVAPFSHSIYYVLSVPTHAIFPPISSGCLRSCGE